MAQLALVADCVADVCAADTSSSDEAVIDFMVLDGEVIFIATPPILLQTNRRIESVEAANTVLVFKINDARVGLRVSECHAAVQALPNEQAIQAHGSTWEVVSIKDSIL